MWIGLSNKTVCALGLIAAVAGCAAAPAPEASRFGVGSMALTAPPPSDSASPIIGALASRQSAIRPGSPYARVSESVLASDARLAEAELEVAELRAAAAERNWLPTIGPRVSLTSLGDVVAELVVNQMLFDNGRKKAERDLARADVERAAVRLVEAGNDRVRDALELYLRAEDGRVRAAHFAEAHGDMSKFEWIVRQRVEGGVSNPSDLTVVRQKLSDIAAKKSAATERTATAMAELNAMAAGPLDDVRGLGVFDWNPVIHEPLPVLAAEADRGRARALARIERAGHLPGLGATAALGRNGASGGLTAETPNGLGFGTRASLKAAAMTEETAERRILETREASDRDLAALMRRSEAELRQIEEAKALRAEAKRNLDLFQAQFEGGQRGIMDVVGVYETYAKAVEHELDLTLEAARTDLSLAHKQGVLAPGNRL